MTLEPTDGEGPTFVVVPPSAVLDDYEVPVDNDTAEALGIVDPDDAFMLAIVAVGADAAATRSTCSARSWSTGTPAGARQVVLVDSEYPLRHPLG